MFEIRQITLCSFLLLLFHLSTYAATDPTWTTNPFAQKVFIENIGQYNDALKNTKVLYYAQQQGVDIYFTATGITYVHNEFIKRNSFFSKKEKEEYEADREKRPRFKLRKHVFKTDFLNSSCHEIIPSEAVTFYYTYTLTQSQLSEKQFAKAFKKLTYKNIYPNIDIEYFLPEKGGIKYNLILHPGADISNVKMKYPDAKKTTIDTDGNLILQSSFGEFIDHAPVSYFENGEQLASTFNLKNKIVTFDINTLSKENITNTQIITIDPWTTLPAFTDFDACYDIQYDKSGNVYTLGSYGPFKLAKLDANGVIKWIYIANGLGATSYFYAYGGFAVDYNTGNSFLADGAKAGAQIQINKINTLGVKTDSILVPKSLVEITRMEFDFCNNQIAIGGGNPNSGSKSNATIDTGLTSIMLYSASTPKGHDCNMLHIDKYSNNYYMFFAQDVNGGTLLNNHLTKLAATNLNTFTFSKPTGHNFNEFQSIQYVGNKSQTDIGYNGIAVNSTYAYTYDGDSLKQFDKNTGNRIGSKDIYKGTTYYTGSGTMVFFWGIN